MFVFRLFIASFLILFSNNSFARYIKNSKQLTVCYNLEALILNTDNNCITLNNYSVFYPVNSYDSLDVFHIKFYLDDGNEKFGFVKKSNALQNSIPQ